MRSSRASSLVSSLVWRRRRSASESSSPLNNSGCARTPCTPVVMSIIAACCQGSRPPNASASNRLRSTMPGRFKPCAISRMRRSSARCGSRSTPARKRVAPLSRSSTSLANKISRSSFCKMRLMGISPSLISAKNAARRSESFCELATEVASRRASTVGNRNE